jgi:hypothetical protein
LPVFIEDLIDTYLSNKIALSTDLTTSVVGAIPVIIVQVCYKAKDGQKALNSTGYTALGIAVLGIAMSVIASSYLDATGPSGTTVFGGSQVTENLKN